MMDLQQIVANFLKLDASQRRETLEVLVQIARDVNASEGGEVQEDDSAYLVGMRILRDSIKAEE